MAVELSATGQRLVDWTAVNVGVLALQGAFAAHQLALERSGVSAPAVRNLDQLASVDALVIPGGESTTMSKLIESAGLFGPIDERIRAGMPVLGTCAGMILLADAVTNGRPDQRSFRAIDIDIERNGYGRQLDSFETDLVVTDRHGTAIEGGSVRGVFIRAPRVTRVGDGVDVLAVYEGVPVLLHSGTVTVASFHPELSDDHRIHEMFVKSIEQPRST